MAKVTKLKSISKSEFQRIVETVEWYAVNHANKEDSSSCHGIAEKLRNTNISKGACFYDISQEEFRRIVLGIDVYNVLQSANRNSTWDDELETIFKKLDKLFIRKYREPAYPQ
ncbi:hypothetical protein N9V84_09585 [Verrucomicrobiales bacterium]|jgi:glucokinase|nr:hypothetical protein [Verrucomicrobiales bacterium]